ncbi:methylated-DNA--[protein]-cysteine S-methyltransferase [Shewanella sp. TC10]|uniref:methylated-DNA--[protein]-cysteine S-methyltransferase n=1 Tax=Shewanella sp. TC10 TaxID=1419739 RepID=UPI0018929F6B|nr:methylated-DNA--[protein]-cysteine S-methyltransferase [Shewanella sp. TC10]
MKINNHPPLCMQVINSPVGHLKLQASAYGLTHLQVVSEPVNNVNQQQPETLEHASAAEISQAKAFIVQAIDELEQYFAGDRQEFDVTLAAKGTEFQQQVWQALKELPFGQVCSYAAIADKIERPKAVRAVGAANGANPIAIIVPCHRVIGKNGSLTGYAYGLEMKQSLLSLEGVK